MERVLAELSQNSPDSLAGRSHLENHTGSFPSSRLTSDDQGTRTVWKRRARVARVPLVGKCCSHFYSLWPPLLLLLLSRSVVSDSVRPHRRQPARLPRPWDSPVRNTGVGCHFLLQCRKVKSEREVAQSCPTLSDPMDCSLPGSSIRGIFQARVLEWGAIAFSRLPLSRCIIGRDGTGSLEKQTAESGVDFLQSRPLKRREYHPAHKSTRSLRAPCLACRTDDLEMDLQMDKSLRNLPAGSLALRKGCKNT